MQTVSASRPLPRALKDLRDGVMCVHIWPMLGWQEVRQRYRRAVIGPFWLTLSAAVFVGGMGPIYSRLLGQPLGEYFPFLAVGFILFQFLSSLMTESCFAFIQGESYIKQMRLPLSIHVLRVVWKNVIVFAHNFTIVILVLCFFPPATFKYLPLAILGIAAIVVNSLWFGLLLGILSARYRDVPPIVASLAQLSLFVTPVMWRPHMLGQRSWLIELNPLYHLIEIVRAPLMGTGAAGTSWLAVLIITIVGWTLSLVIFGRFRARIAYWV